MRHLSPRAAISGIGELTPQRRTEDVATMDMLMRVSAEAIADAGLAPSEVDGLLVGPQVGETPQHVPAAVAEYFGMQPTMANMVDLGGASGPGMIWRAAAAIAAGQCETVLCVLGNHRNPVAPRSPNRNPAREFDTPFGASGANTSYALLMQAHMARYGCEPEDYAALAAGSRANAQFNPAAIFHGAPASVDDVLASPMIASPLHLFEIVMPVAGGEAVIVTTAERAAKGPHRPVHLLGAGEKVTHRAVSQAPDLTSGPLKPSIARALGQAGMDVAQVDFLSLYDCYTIMLAATIEDAGLCAPGEFGLWLRDNGGMGSDARQPINTHGGQLGFGQPDLAGGMTHVVEAVRQIRGDTPGRQIAGCNTALVTGNGATMSEAVALVLGGAS
ncbi:thiolase family protein [Marinovum sp. 2_MG-2023]|uniref:thiolase family protein n=1 Tax=unclassified Marinovum TaxID=2647166 RepID=UPI0026E12171|nr:MULTISPECIES: thiolase family protein [unclassified Marinovum]MDO6729091.1 thiolase family protein [Marinovum sp. 2_MG-2023]MDO6779282.1 thiolase family protein [Marinovum sp. 1_MG-2023]